MRKKTTKTWRKWQKRPLGPRGHAHFRLLAARLKPCPFKTGQNEFPQSVKPVLFTPPYPSLLGQIPNAIALSFILVVVLDLAVFQWFMLGTGALLLLVFASLVVVLLLVLLQLTRLGYLIRTTIPDRPRQRMFIASSAFLLTFIGTRFLVHLILHNIGPFQWVVVRGHHIHHLVWGILILLMVGYGWLLDLGRSHSSLSIFFGRLMAVSYGVGAALTLDEFALWLNLEPDAYWSRAGRISIDAVIFFGALLGVGAWGAPFFRGLQKMWGKGAYWGRGLGRGIGRLSLPIRRARLLRPRKVRRSPPHNVS